MEPEAKGDERNVQMELENKTLRADRRERMSDAKEGEEDGNGASDASVRDCREPSDNRGRGSTISLGDGDCPPVTPSPSAGLLAEFDKFTVEAHGTRQWWEWMEKTAAALEFERRDNAANAAAYCETEAELTKVRDELEAAKAEIEEMKKKDWDLENDARSRLTAGLREALEKIAKPALGGKTQQSIARAAKAEIELLNTIIDNWTKTHSLVLAENEEFREEIVRLADENSRLREALREMVSAAVAMPVSHDNLWLGTLDRAVREARAALTRRGE